MTLEQAFWPVFFAILSTVVSTVMSIQQAKASQRVQEQAAAEAAQFRHQELILAEEQAALEQQRAHTEALLRNQQLQSQAALVSQDISLVELSATQEEMNRRDAARRLAATNVAAFGGDPTSPSFRAFMESNEEVAKRDIGTLHLNSMAVRFGLTSELGQIGLQEEQNILGAEYVAQGAEYGLVANRIAADAAASRDRARVRLAGIRGNAMIGRSLISGASKIGKAYSSANVVKSGNLSIP
jgi:hypothetical protein